MEGLAYPSTYFRDGAVDLGNVYIAMDSMGTIIGVYKCPDRAVDQAAAEVAGHFLDSVHVEVSDIAIFVEGEKGKVTILIEQLK
tara:strand:+ start:2082 stop:2333 length:252 start_codon:yes stop_codon:yes gene_type:complete